MSELVLYRKHRPRDFSEVTGQEHVVGALMRAFETNRTAHAYLFSGPRGVGKTTIARLIAKSFNCAGAKKPCNTCTFCNEFNEARSLNLIEIDAASNRGIDEIRELRDAVRFAPAAGAYKTYIIDEAHMLTGPAFNALLKTLEEPPAHAVFVLATTELEKLPATIVSRTQHYTFRRPNVETIAARLMHVSKKENVALEKDAAQLIALAAEGSLRDGESILGQIMAASDKSISRENVEHILGLPKRESAKEMFSLVANKDARAALALVQHMTDAGQDANYMNKTLLQYFRTALFLKTDPSLRQYIEGEMLPDELEAITAHLPKFSEAALTQSIGIITDNTERFASSPIPQLGLEVTLVELANQEGAQS